MRAAIRFMLLAFIIAFAPSLASANSGMEQMLLEDAMGRAWFGQQLQADENYRRLPPENKAERRIQLGQQWAAMDSAQKKAAFEALPPAAKERLVKTIKDRWQPDAAAKAKRLERARATAVRRAKAAEGKAATKPPASAKPAPSSVQ